MSNLELVRARLAEFSDLLSAAVTELAISEGKRAEMEEKCEMYRKQTEVSAKENRELKDHAARLNAIAHALIR